jgi:hypothetical protein
MADDLDLALMRFNTALTLRLRKPEPAASGSAASAERTRESRTLAWRGAQREDSPPIVRASHPTGASGDNPSGSGADLAEMTRQKRTPDFRRDFASPSQPKKNWLSRAVSGLWARVSGGSASEGET